MERLNSLLSQIQDEYLVKFIDLFQVISEQLSSASRAGWLSVALPFVVIFALMFLIPWLALRALPWILMVLLKILLNIIFMLIFFLLYTEGCASRLIRKCRPNPPVFIYKIGDIFGNCIILIQDSKREITKFNGKIISQRWVFRKKRWYAVSLILAPAYMFSVQPENIKELNESVNCYLSNDCYQVREGDYLGKIAKKYHISVEEIISANKEKHPQLAKTPDLIDPGLRLKIPQKGTAQ